MYNKKVLSDSIKKLRQTGPPPKKADKVVSKPIVSTQGYKQGPPPAGTHYRIPGNNGTTSIYNPTPYSLNLVGPNGTQAQIGPWDTNTQNFNEPYMDEFHKAAYGGDISIPDLNQYEDGGEYDLTDEEIAQLKAGGYIVEELPKAQFGPVGYAAAPKPTGLIPAKTAAQVQKQELAKGKGPTREVAQKVDQAAKQRAEFEKQEAARKKAEEQKRLKQEAGKPAPASSTYVTPTTTQFADSFGTPLEDKKVIDAYNQKLIDSGVAAEMLGNKYWEQSGNESLSSMMNKEILNPDFEQNVEDARYRIWKRGEEKTYQNAGYGDRLLNELVAFAGDPLLQVSKALQGKRSLWGQGYRSVAGENFDDTRFYDRANDRSIYGQLASDIVNIFNPMYYGGKAGYDITKGDYLSGAANVGQGLLAGSSLSKSNTLKKLFDTQMGVETITDLPEISNTLSDPELDPKIKAGLIAMQLGFLKSGVRTLKPGAQYYMNAFRKKGGSLPDIPKKKGSKGYSRSLEATNQLFAQNPLLKKPKSKKRKIFDPNAKYYAEGGFQDDINKHRDLLRDWTYGQSIGMLQEKQIGGQKYSYAGRKDAIYTKDTKGNWLIKTPGTGMKWQPIDDPTGNRTNLLNKQARPLTEDAKVVKNKQQMAIVNAKRKENILKNLRNEVKVFENEEKYLPHHKVDIGESTKVDTGINKQFFQSKHEAKRERIEDIKKALNQEAYNKKALQEQKWRREAENLRMRGIHSDYKGANGPWNNYGDAPAQSVDWVWTLPLAAAKAPQIIEAASTIGTIGSEALDAPLTIGAVTPKAFGLPITAGNVLRGFYAGKAALSIPDVIKQVDQAKTTDEQVSALRTVVNTVVGASPLVKWHNPLYSNLATPLSFAEHLRKFTSANETVDPVAGSANLMRTISILSKKDGGDVWEDDIDDETRAELEAQGYIIEDLD